MHPRPSNHPVELLVCNLFAHNLPTLTAITIRDRRWVDIRRSEAEKKPPPYRVDREVERVVFERTPAGLSRGWGEAAPAFVP